MEIDSTLVSGKKGEELNLNSIQLLQAANICGRVALIVGWSIFLVWLIVLAITGNSFQPLMVIGLYWIVIGFFIGIIGLICLITFAIINRKKRQPNSIKSLAVLLAGIPSVFIILYLVTLTGHL